jgi:hypothetical protein
VRAGGLTGGRRIGAHNHAPWVPLSAHPGPGFGFEVTNEGSIAYARIAYCRTLSDLSSLSFDLNAIGHFATGA